MSKYGNIALWVIQIMAALLFLLQGGQKLLGMPEVAENFARWGYPDFMPYLIGIFEILGAIGLLIPRMAGLAAVGLIIIMIGALYTHVTHGEFGMAPIPLIVIVLLGLVVYNRNPLRMFGSAAETTL